MKKVALFALVCCSALFAQETSSVETSSAEASAAKITTAGTITETTAVTPATETVAESQVRQDELAKPPTEPATSAVADSATVGNSEGAALAVGNPSASSQEVAAVAVPESRPALVRRSELKGSTIGTPDENRKKSSEPCILCNEVQNALGDSLAKKWTHFIGAAITVPIAQYKINSQKIDFIDYGINISYMGASRWGFSTRLSISAGGSATDNIRFDDSDDWQIGTYGAVELGAGMSFVNNSFFTFALFAMVGIEYVMFETEENAYDHKELGSVDRSFNETLAGLTLGGDLVMRISLTERIGLFASVGGRWVANTASETTVKYRQGDYTRTESILDDGHGNFSIVPALGIMWRF